MPKVTSLGTAHRHVKRLRQVVRVLVKYGFGRMFERIRLWEHMNIERRMLRRHDREFNAMSTPERLRLALEELGPTFIKLGQVLSTRSDLLPPEYIVELEKLQSEVAPMSSGMARRTLESELSRPVEEVFTAFEESPVAAASLAQVHRASLSGGRVVAIKIQQRLLRKWEANISYARLTKSLLTKNGRLFQPLLIC